MDSARYLQNKADAESKRVNQPIYRIGNKDPITGLYEVLDSTSSVVGYGQKIFNNTFEYGDVVRATKPFGSSVWALDKIDIIAKKVGETPSPTTPPSPPTPPDPPSPTPPSNGFPVSPPSTPSVTPPTTTYNPPPKTPPPFNCGFPPSGCRWQDASIPCNGKIQDYDYAILNTGTLVLCCDPSVTPPDNGGCTPYGYQCVNGVCVPTRGAGQTLAQCQAGLVPSKVKGGQCKGISYLVNVTLAVAFIPGNPSPTPGTASFITDGAVNFSEGQVGLLSTETGNNAIIGTSNGVVVQTYQGVSTSNTRLADAAVYSVTYSVECIRLDGLPDNCGDPPPSCS